jgi:VCBS repeat protein
MRSIRHAGLRFLSVPFAIVVVVMIVASSASAAVARPRFGAPKPFNGIAKETLTLAGDVNGDGRPDLVSGGTDLVNSTIVSVVVIQLNTGRGFGALNEIVVRSEHAGNGLDTIRLADLNHDGALDVIGGFENVFPAASNLFVMLGHGDGTFGAAALLTNGDAFTLTLLSVAVGDVTGDGNPDLISSDGTVSPNRLSVLPGHGDGTFGAPIFSGDTSIHWKPALEVADFTGDGIPDVLAADSPLDPDFGATDVFLEQGKGDGTFTLAATLFIDGNATDDLRTADLNGDGRRDLAVTGSAGTNGGRGGLFVALAAGTGLAAPTHYPVTGVGLAVGDFNLDGHADLATGAAVSPYLWISVNSGAGTFSKVVTFAGTAPQVAAAADFSGDAKPDVITENFSDTLPAALFVNVTT